MTNVYTYSNPYLSLWQSAAADVQRRQASVQSRVAAVALAKGQAAPVAAQLPDLMNPVYMLGMPLRAGQTDAPDKMFAPAEPKALAAGAVILDCAKTAAEFLWAEIKGDHQEADTLAAELKDSECDPLWAECLATYLAFKASMGSIPYRTNLNPVFSLDNNTKVAIIGDWGTGEKEALHLLQEVVRLGQPDVVLHVGDIYYSGTQDEAQSNFLDMCQQTLGSNVRVFSLCGNHDVYSGGDGYYWLVDRLGQQASYFCLQNANWQFLAMDTGYNDNDPFTVGTNMTGLVTIGNWAEEDWHLDKINTAGNRATVLLSHHQLFSPFGSVGTADGGLSYAYNKNLRASFQAVMKQIAWWFWGHEHTLAIYDPYMDLKRGRCVGASAVPVFDDQQSYTTAGGMQTYGGLPYPTWNKQGQLATNMNDYNHCFAIMTLTGASANVDYYQIAGFQPATRLPVDDKI